MKFTADDLANLREAIAPHDTEHRRDLYRDGQFPRADRVTDLDMRYRWDLFWAVGGYDVIGRNRYNTAHIDTALRALVPAVTSTVRASS